MEKYKTKKNNDKKYLSSVVDLSYSELSNELDKEVEAINSSILSLESISKRLGVSHTILRTLFPEKCKIIASRYIKFREIKTKYRIQTYENKLIEVMDQLHDEGKFPSFHRLSKFIQIRTPELMELRRQHLLELGY